MIVFGELLRQGNAASKQQLKAYYTSAGVLGTFGGIVLGLSDLELGSVQTIQSGIEDLLSGVETAFYTSIFGLFASIAINFLPDKFFRKKASGKDTKQGTDDLLRDILGELKVLNRNIIGEADSTLITQIQKLRTTFIDKHDELNKSFNEFADKLVEDNTQSLVDALTNVMKDFNTKINEQFGENFKHLNEGVGKMLEWQQEYREQIELSIQSLDSSAKSMELSSTSLETISQEYNRLIQLSESVSANLENMGIFIGSIKSLAESLEGNGATIKKEIEELTQKSLNELGIGLASISEKLVSDYSRLQAVINQIAVDNS
jgi:methyl-accepting chemotaxis protein